MYMTLLCLKQMYDLQVYATGCVLEIMPNMCRNSHYIIDINI